MLMQLDFVEYIMKLYVRNGFKELGNDKLPTLINMKYHSPVDAVNKLKMQPQQIRDFYLGMQQQLYNGLFFKASTYCPNCPPK